MMKTNQTKTILFTAVLLGLAACGQANQQSSHEQKLAENEKKIELLKQEAEIKRLENQVAQAAAGNAPATAQQADNQQVYQLDPNAVASTIPQNLQAQAKSSGQAVTGTDGQQYMYDPDSGSWLLYGAIGAAAGYLVANALNNKNAAKYQPVTKPTAAVQRVYKDYRAKYPTPPRATLPAPTTQINQNQTNQQNTRSTPNYRPVQAAPQTAPAQNTTATPNYRQVQTAPQPTGPSRGGFGFGSGRRGRR